MINYERRGSGEPLVLVHGLGSRWQVWEPVLDALAESRDVIALDLPGFGASAPLAGPTTVDTLTDAVAQFCRDLGLERPHVAGNSMGGAIALKLGERGLAPSVTAFSPAGFSNKPERIWARETLEAARAATKVAKGALPTVLGNPVGRFAALSLFVAKAYALSTEEALGHAEGLAEAQRFDEALQSLMELRFTRSGRLDDIPVTIAWGVLDLLLVYPTQSRRAKQVLPRARHVALSSCGHVPFSDDPKACTDLLLKKQHVLD